MDSMQRLKHVFAIDIETCPDFGGTLRVIACIEEPGLMHACGCGDRSLAGVQATFSVTRYLHESANRCFIILIRGMVFTILQDMNRISLLHKPGLIAILGPSIQVENHSHHALQVAISLSHSQGSELFEVSVEMENLDGPGFIVAADTVHRVQGSNCLIMLIEAESHLAERLSKRFLQNHNHHVLSPAQVNEVVLVVKESPFDWPMPDLALSKLIHGLCLERHLEPRIQKITEWFDIADSNGEWENVNLESALDRTHLSQSRFLHLFVEQTGIAWRRYLLWRRLLSSVKYALAGHSLTESALHAGFSDSSHFSRVFRSMFGINPGAIIKNVTLKQ